MFSCPRASWLVAHRNARCRHPWAGRGCAYAGLLPNHMAAGACSLKSMAAPGNDRWPLTFTRCRRYQKMLTAKLGGPAISMLRPKQLFGAKPRLQNADPPPSVRPYTYLEKGSYILGKLSVGGDVHIEGVVIGDISAAGEVTVGESAQATSRIRAGSIVVAGKVTGDIVALEQVEIRRTARVFGNLS